MRIKALKSELENAGLDGYLMTDVKNVYYFTGFLDISEATLCLITPLDGDPVLWTYPLSYTAACERSKGCGVKVVKAGEKIFETTAGDIRSFKLRRVGFDSLQVPTYLELKEKLKDTEFKQNTDVFWKLRRVKTEKEVAYMRRASELADKGMEAATEAVKTGVHEYEVAAEAEHAMRVRGSEGTAFETVVASGPRSAYPHGVCADRVIRDGDLVILDLGAVHRGYRSDITRTVVAGKPSSKQSEIFNLVQKAQEKALRHTHAGAKTKEVDAAARKIIKEGGYGECFIHGLGHGVGLDIHEPPRLSPTSEEVLEEGNVVTDEPAVYIQGFGGVRIEDTILVHKEKGERLTKAAHGGF